MKHWCWYDYERARISFIAEVYGWSSEDIFDATLCSTIKQLQK